MSNMNNWFNLNKILNVRKSKLIKNMSWLFILNFVNTIIPYFTFPYISRVFLPEGFGIVAFSTAFIAYFLTFIDYGFNLTGSRKVALVENDEKKLSRVYSSIILTKMLFFIVSVPVIIVITLAIPKLYQIKDIIYVLIIVAFSHVIIPTWLYHGLQKVKYITIISFSVRTLFLVCVFTMVKSQEDILLYTLLYSFTFLLTGIASLILVRKFFGVKFCKIGFREIRDTIKDGFHVFTSSVVISVMGTSGVFVLGLFHPPVYTGYYSGVSKINIVITKLFYPVGQALFPHNSKKYTDSFEKGYVSVKKVAKIILPIFTGLILIVIIFRKSIVNLVLGPDYVYAANLMIILAFLPLLSIISNFMGTQILVASGHTKEYSKAFLRSAMISIFLYFVLGYFFAMWGVTIAAFTGAVFNLIFLYMEIRKILKNNKKEQYTGR